MSSHASLSAAADDRKARLAKLRSIKRKHPDDEVVAPESDRLSPAPLKPPQHEAAQVAEVKDDTATPDVARLHLSGRNYDPEARGAKLGFEAPPSATLGTDTLEAKAAALEEDVRKEDEDAEDADGGDSAGSREQQRQIDLFKLQPKKPNWDLKRALNKRLEPLNVQTDNAIARLVRQRLATKLASTASKDKGGEARASTAANADAKVANVTNGSGCDDEGALEGAALVEGIRIREQEAEEEERREREAEEENEA